MTGIDIGRFLNDLPVGLSGTPAVGAMAAVARHVSATLGFGPPPAFANIETDAPDGVIDLLANLDDEACSPDLLGLVWEQLLSGASRRSQGAHFTPHEAAGRVVRLVLDDQDRRGTTLALRLGERIWDPAAGGGAFLLAAARQILAVSDRSRSEIVSSMFASDIDPVALRVCETALWMWSGGSTQIRTCHGDALTELPPDWPTDFAMIVGNPPFLGQLTTDTARGSDVAERLKAEYGALAHGYVDQAALFVELGLRRLGEGGALGLILPQSFLGARDALGVRSSALARAELASLWIDDAGLFDAAVEVIAISMVRRQVNERGSDARGSYERAGDVTAGEQTAERTLVGIGDSSRIEIATPDSTSWAPLLAASQGVPVIQPPSGSTRLGDVAHVTAGFRQHFYGIADAVRDTNGAGDTPNDNTAALITSGLIDPLANLWGQRRVKFAGTSWNAPVVAIDSITDEAVRRWFRDRCVPKILLASQTPVIEAIVDPSGRVVPSVPVISVEPHDPDMLWHLAAVVTAPVISAVLLTEAAGTGLSSSAVRVRASSIADVVLPERSSSWDSGAAAAQAAHRAWDDGDEDSHADWLVRLAEEMVEAYGGAPSLVSWWAGRLRKR